MAVSTKDMKAGMGMDLRMDEMLMTVRDLEVCIYSLS